MRGTNSPSFLRLYSPVPINQSGILIACQMTIGVKIKPYLPIECKWFVSHPCLCAIALQRAGVKTGVQAWIPAGHIR